MDYIALLENLWNKALMFFEGKISSAVFFYWMADGLKLVLTGTVASADPSSCCLLWLKGCRHKLSSVVRWHRKGKSEEVVQDFMELKSCYKFSTIWKKLLRHNKYGKTWIQNMNLKSQVVEAQMSFILRVSLFWVHKPRFSSLNLADPMPSFSWSVSDTNIDVMIV